MIGIYHHVDTPRLQLLLRYMVVGRGHYNNRSLTMLCPKCCTELTNVLSRLLLTVYHNAIGPCLHITECTRKRIVHTFPTYQALNTCNDHKIMGDLSLFTGLNFINKLL